MADQAPSRFNVTSDDIRRYDWQTRLVQHPVKDCGSYYPVLIAAAKACETANDDLGNRVYSLLYSIASFFPNYDAKGNPYGPIFRGVAGNRSIMAEDLKQWTWVNWLGTLTSISSKYERNQLQDCS